jgi:hypothetical protein
MECFEEPIFDCSVSYKISDDTHGTLIIILYYLPRLILICNYINFGLSNFSQEYRPLVLLS